MADPSIINVFPAAGSSDVSGTGAFEFGLRDEDTRIDLTTVYSLVTYAKAMGNGFPIAAIAGKEEVMMTIEPGKVAHGGTYSGNVVGTAAANAVLEILETQPILETIHQRGRRLMACIDEILTRHSIPHVMTGVPPMFGYILGTEEPPTDFRAYMTGDEHLYEAIGLGLIARGVFPEADGREPWFLCYSLSDADIDETAQKFDEAVQAAL